jgi:1A family penicillin-binding protein
VNGAIHYSEDYVTGFLRQPARALGLGVFLLAGAALGAQQPNAADTEPWRITPSPQASLVIARDGSVIGEIGREWRLSVPIRSLPKYLPQAFVAIEDRRFYQHNGVDVVGIAGAIKDDILGNRRGASTITQQLVGNMHPSVINRAEKSIGRKLREQSAALEMERHYTKEQILEAYLNQISFGHGWFGVEEAARHYFGKSAAKLSLAEAATLAAMPKSPVLYDPVREAQRTRERRNLVLAAMADQGYITRAEASSAAATSLATVRNHGTPPASQYYVDVVRIQAARAGVPVSSGGYRIYTALDPALQREAAEALEEEARAIESRPGYDHPSFIAGAKSDYIQGMVVAMDPVSGDVRALVGGRDYEQSPFDRAVDAMRQPGSAFKPFVYAAAIADSLTPLTLVADTALHIRLPGGAIYSPMNSDRQFLGEITLRDALTRSRNPVAVQLGLSLGMDTIAALAHRMGIKSAIAPYPSSAIGASVVQPLDLVAAYTAFANLGTAVEPRFIQRIEDASGRAVLTRPMAALAPAMDPRAAFVVRDMMRDVVDRGTASSIRRYVPSDIPVAGKTGTTDDNTDVWFIGMTPDLVAGVWLGFDKPKPISSSAAGGSLAAPVWGKMVARYYGGGRRFVEWTPPPGVIKGDFDRLTHLPATPLTPPAQRYTEYFVEGTEPLSLRADPWKLFSAGPIVF